MAVRINLIAALLIYLFVFSAAARMRNLRPPLRPIDGEDSAADGDGGITPGWPPVDEENNEGEGDLEASEGDENDGEFDGDNDDEDLDNRIINGFTPGRFDMPFVVRLRVNFTDGLSLCSGALISALWVVTAGHCGSGAQSIEVQLGLFTRNEGPEETLIVPQNNIIVHENFIGTPTQIRNDIALLRLPRLANTLSRRIRPILFACEGDGTFEGRGARSCGWGDTTDNATQSAETLQCVDMPVISNTLCRQSWPTFIFPDHICTATINNRTTCSGDSGGPLFVFDLLNRPQLIGLTSFGSDPCQSTIPSVNTRISAFSRWITRKTLRICDIL